jgi:hypothetical protein
VIGLPWSKEAVFLTVGVAVVGGVLFRERIGGVNDVRGLGGGGGRAFPLPPPEPPVGTNSLANGLGWKPGLSLRFVAGEEVRDSGREASLECGSREDCDIGG